MKDKTAKLLELAIRNAGFNMDFLQKPEPLKLPALPVQKTISADQNSLWSRIPLCPDPSFWNEHRIAAHIDLDAGRVYIRLPQVDEILDSEIITRGLEECFQRTPPGFSWTLNIADHRRLPLMVVGAMIRFRNQFDKQGTCIEIDSDTLPNDDEYLNKLRDMFQPVR